MAEFLYQAKDASGENRSGEIVAESRDKAIQRLHARGLTLLGVEEMRPRHWIWGLLQPVRRAVLVLFIRQLAAMLAAGIPIVRCLEVLVTSHQGLFRKSLERVFVSVSSGFSLSQALRRDAKYYLPFFVGAVRIGETSGRIPETLNRCASYLETDHAYNLKLRAALVYPCVLLLASALLVGFVFTFMVPRFVQLFVDLRMQLPWPTRVLMAASGFVSDHLITVLLTAAGPLLLLGWLLVQWMQSPGVGLVLEGWMLRLPVYGRHIRYRMMSQYLRYMATLIDAGVPLNVSLGLMQHALERKILALTAAMQLQALKDGMPLSFGLSRVGIFPPMVMEMLVVGEETGKMSEMMERLARFYDDEMVLGLANISKMIEPMVIFFVGGVVGFLLLAAFLPIYQLAGSF